MEGALSTDVCRVSDTGALTAAGSLSSAWTQQRSHMLIEYAELHRGEQGGTHHIRFFLAVANRLAWESIIENHS